jgi:hypothetical protein
MLGTLAVGSERKRLHACSIYTQITSVNIHTSFVPTFSQETYFIATSLLIPSR